MAQRISELSGFFRRFRWRRIVTASLLLLGLSLLALGLSVWFWEPAERDYSLTITAGSSAGTRNQLAEFFSDRAAESAVELTVVPTAGSFESLGKVETGEIDLALVQGGIRLPRDTAVRQVATIYVEPLHLLVKAELLGEIKADLGKLRGRTINLSRPGSGTNLLSRQVLAHVGLSPKDYTPAYLSYDEILDRLADREAAELPDAVFLVTTLPSRVAGELVRAGGYRLVPLPFAEAFSLISVEEEADGIDQSHITEAVIPEYAYGVSPAVPPEPCRTLGTPMMLVAHKDVPADAVTRMLAIVYGPTLRRLYDPPPLDGLAVEYPLHVGSVEYRDRDKPIVRADVTEVMQSLLSIGGPIIGGLLALYGFYRTRQLMRFNSYFHELRELEAVARGWKPDESLPRTEPERGAALVGRIEELERGAVRDFCDNYFYGEGVLDVLLALAGELKRRVEGQRADG